MLKPIGGDEKKKERQTKSLLGSLRGKCGKICIKLEFLGRKKKDKKLEEVLVSPASP